MNLFPKFLILIWLICLPTLFFTFSKYVTLNKPIDFNSELKLGEQNFNIRSNSSCVGNFKINFFEDQLSTYKIDMRFILALKLNGKMEKVRFESVLQFNPFLQLSSTSNRLKFGEYALTLSSFGINQIRYTVKLYKGQNATFRFDDKFTGPFELKQVSSDTFILSNFNPGIFEGIKDNFPGIINNKDLKIESDKPECEPESLDLSDLNIKLNSLLKLMN